MIIVPSVFTMRHSLSQGSQRVIKDKWSNKVSLRNNSLSSLNTSLCVFNSSKLVDCFKLVAPNKQDSSRISHSKSFINCSLQYATFELLGFYSLYDIQHFSSPEGLEPL